MFSERLSFLMNITDTQNSMLAQAVKLDPSHISRLRHGTRKPPSNENYVYQMCLYFVRHTKNDFQRKVIQDSMHLESLPKEETKFATLLSEWLSSKKSTSNFDPENIISAFAMADRQSKLNTSTSMSSDNQEINYYYGNQGKREAVLRLFNSILLEEQPQVIFLFSDENIEWISEDKIFSRKWQVLLSEIISRGNKLRIIHTINRESGAMREAVTNWLPIYMKGSLEPYFYPKLRDGLFQRTMYIATRTGAVVSNSVMGNTTEMLSFYVSAPDAINALALEYERYFSVCKSLMTVYSPVNAERYFTDFASFTRKSSKSILFTPVPSLMTMPREVAESIAKRCESTDFLAIWEVSAKEFELNVAIRFDEIVADNEYADDARIHIPMADMYSKDELYYTKEEYLLHKENIKKIMQHNKNYHAYFVNVGNVPIMIWGKEDAGVLLSNTERPTTIFAISEYNLTSAFWEFLVAKLKKIKADNE